MSECTAFAIQPGASVTLENIGLVGNQCPKCGGEAVVPHGTYTLVGEIVRAASAPDVTREGLARFGEIAKRVQAGAVAKEAATTEIEAFSATLAALWRMLGQPQIATLLAILAILIPIWFNDDKSTADQAHRDAEQQQELSRAILKELQQQGEVPEARPSEAKVAAAAATVPSLRHGGQNRHERRKAASKARRAKKPRS